MGLLTLGIVLVLVGLILAFTNVLGFAGLGSAFVWVGWLCVAIGVVLAIVHLVAGRRTVVVGDRRRGIL